jgi:hypothetical protein
MKTLKAEPTCGTTWEKMKICDLHFLYCPVAVSGGIWSCFLQMLSGCWRLLQVVMTLGRCRSPGTTLCVPSWDWVEELWPCNPVVEGSIAATSAQMSSKSGAGRGVISSSIHVPSSMWPQRKPQTEATRTTFILGHVLPPKTRVSKQRARTLRPHQ